MTAADCVVPPELVRCLTCQDGSERCQEVSCVDRLCALRWAPCPELEPAFACTSDADCAQQPCLLKCQGNGRDACFRAACTDGVCPVLHSTCGPHLEPCPPGTRAAVECGACGLVGGCMFYVSGCFQTCETLDDCPEGGR